MPSGSLNYLAVAFVGCSEVALNPWPLWHTEEWLGSPGHLKKKRKKRTVVQPSFILRLDDHEQSRLRLVISIAPNT